MIKIGIIGYGFVGQAIDYAFTSTAVEKFYVDPKLGTTMEDLIEFDPQYTFVCVPTPMRDDGTVEDGLVKRRSRRFNISPLIVLLLSNQQLLLIQYCL